MLTTPPQETAGDVDDHAIAMPTDPAVQLLAIGLLRHLAHLHGVNESLLTGERGFDLAIPDQSSLSPETPRAEGTTENHDET